MKVVLLQKVPDLGNLDEIKEVADGYARNFLFPKHLAVQASAQVLAQRSAKHKRLAKEVENELHTEQSLAARVDGLEIEIKEKASDKGQLYAAVTATRIANELKKMGLAVNKEQIIGGPFKEAGEYPVKIKFRHNLEVEITVIVLAS